MFLSKLFFHCIGFIFNKINLNILWELFEKYSLFRYISIVLLSSIFSITFTMYFGLYYKKILLDHVKISANILLIRKEFELLRNLSCESAGYDINKCPLQIRSFKFHYDTERQKFNDSGAWCMGHKDMLSKPNDYFESRELYMSSTCKEYIKSHSGFVRKKEFEKNCPFVAKNCLFKSYNNEPLEYATFSCTNDINHQGMSCFAMVDGENVEDFRLSIANLSVSDILIQRLVNSKLSYFQD